MPCGTPPQTKDVAHVRIDQGWITEPGFLILTGWRRLWTRRRVHVLMIGSICRHLGRKTIIPVFVN